MAKPRHQLDLPLPARAPDQTRQQWLYTELRHAILTRRLAPGTRLPASRELARQHALSRSTVVAAFEQLVAEGYLTGRVGAGTTVARTLPDQFVRAPRTAPAAHPRPNVTAVAAPAAPPAALVSTAFRPCAPAADTFPLTIWSRLIGRRLRRDGPAMLARGDPRGQPDLRAAIAAYLGAARSVRCTPDQVMIVSGTQQALDLCTRLLVRPGEAVWIENPGYEGAVAAFQQGGAKLIPVPVDTDGFDVAAALRRAPQPRLAYVTPAHQFPLGTTLALDRRVALLQAAERGDFYILEDDYDGEFRYDVRPLGSLQGQDHHDRVIYAGSFNKLLHAGLRLGYLVLPPALVDRFVALREATDRYLPTLEQTALADFFAEGHFERHLRRARAVCLERRDALLHAIDRHLTDHVEVGPITAGFHVLARLRGGLTDEEVQARAALERVNVTPLAPFYLEAPRRDQILLGFAPHAPAVLQAAARRLALALRT